METNEERLRSVYRAYIAEELASPEIIQDKEKLMAFFEAPAPAPVFSLLSAGFAAPAVALLGLFLVFHQVQLKAPVVAGPSAPLYQDFTILKEEKPAAPAYDVQPQDNPVKNHMKPRVVVKRVSSRVGATMVYQKVYRGTPVTIVWVFTPHHGPGL
jgi:hypothetical protein